MDSYYDDGGCCIVHPDSTDLILTGGRGPLTQTNWSFVVSYSRDGGKTWTRCNPTPASAGFCRALAVAPSQTSVIYAGGDVAGAGAVYRSTDFGSTWTQTATAPTDTVFSLVVDAADAAKVFAATPNGVFATTDAGATWDRLMSADLRAVLQYPGSPDTLVVGGTSGVFISTDGGGVWDPMDSGLEGSAVTALAFADHGGTYLIAGTKGGSCYAWQFEAGIIEGRGAWGAGRGTGSHVQALPNPFVSSCVVVGHEREQFSVFDHSGRQVSVARGDRIGAGLAAGVYFLQTAQAQAQAQAPVRVVKIR
jgi:photosystem II stability/assembly factor-like uncharacterized protein